ncbi:MAG TPA: PAS domain S-box protein [Gemmatimonadaceae bacterium]|nr:PAS domain S-box protein [Gemmatimonadaceae bacterium]
MLLGAIVWHVSDLEDQAIDAARQRLPAMLANATHMLDVWAAERETDASALAEMAEIHGSDSVRVSPELAGRILSLQLRSVQRRGAYAGVWIVGASGKVLANVTSAALTGAERQAIAAALLSGVEQFARPEAHDSTVTISVVLPVSTQSGSRPQIEAAVVLRSDLSRAFISTGAPRTSSIAPVLVIPGAASAISLCPGPTARLCLVPQGGRLPRIVAGMRDTVMRYTRRSGERMLVGASRAHVVPWTIYYPIPTTTLFAPVDARLRFEALAFLGLLLLVGLTMYALDRTAHLRRLTERAQSEARFAAIVNTAMDAILIVDSTFRIVVVNNAVEEMFRIAYQEAMGCSLLELIPDASGDELRRMLEQTIRAGEKPRLFAPDRYAAGRRSDGSMFPIDLSVSRTQIDGHPHLTIVIRDITDWRRAEENSEWQRRVLEAIATGVELRDVLGTVVRFHETQCPGIECSIHLIDDDAVTLRSASAPSMRPEFVEAMDEIVIGPHASTCGTAVYRREQVITADVATDRLWDDYRALALEQGYRACWAETIRSPQGRMLGALTMYIREARRPTLAELRVSATAVQLAGIAVDRAYAAESLRQSEASFRSFVENSPIGIYRATGHGRFLAVNESLVRLLGFESALDLLHVDMSKDLFVSPTDRDQFLHRLQTQGELRGSDMEWRRKDGTTVTVRVSARAYRDDRGLVWFSEGFVENVTPLRAAEQALRQSEKLAALGQLVSGVAHELNNPLASILHFAEDLLEDERTASDHEAISIIRDQARRSRSIVRDLLSFVRFRDASRERVHLTEALVATAKALRPVVEDTGAKLVAELPTEPVYGNTDRAGLQQIVTNLAVNAAQASGAGGTVRIHTSIQSDELRIVVEDTGPGIPPALMDRIFEPFFTTKPLGEGTGLGLSVTLGIVQQLRGRIEVENRPAADGGGARFTVALPIGGEGVEDPGPVIQTMPATRDQGPNGAVAPRALIIDDEPSIRAALRRFFVRRGWVVDEASDGAHALSMLLTAKLQYALVISDLKMPGCSGVELHDHVAGVAPELLDRIIFSTGDVASREAAEFVGRTRCMVLQKPFELRMLESIVSRIRQMATA